MSRVRDFFLEEASTCLDTLKSAGVGQPDPARLHAAARLLRGSARLARYGELAAEAGRLEQRLRQLAEGGDFWSEDIAARVRLDVEALERSVHQVRDGLTQPDERTEMSTEDQSPATLPEIPIEDLEYTGEAALERALDLRAPLEDGILDGEPVGAILDEIFDLIRLGTR